MSAGAARGGAAQRAGSRRATSRAGLRHATSGAGYLAAAALVVLAGRALAYALLPAPAGSLVSAAGGPALPVVALVSGALAISVACAVLWLASLGVRERALLEPRAVSRPREPMRATAARAAALFAASALLFAAFESYLHWRAGLGFHGLHCLTGPVHRDALPILAALAIVASALIAALRHVVAWMRRTLALLRAPRVRPRRTLARPRTETPRTGTRRRPASTRGPPRVAV